MDEFDGNRKRHEIVCGNGVIYSVKATAVANSSVKDKKLDVYWLFDLENVARKTNLSSHAN